SCWASWRAAAASWRATVSSCSRSAMRSSSSGTRASRCSASVSSAAMRSRSRSCSRSWAVVRSLSALVSSTAERLSARVGGAGYDRAMPDVAFVLSPRQDGSLRELAEVLGHELGLQAVTSSLHLEGFPQARPDRVYVLLDPGGYVAAEGEAALPDDAIMRRTVALWAEPPPSDAGDPRLEILRRAGSVFAIDQRAVVALSRLGIRARLVRPGYSRLHDHFDAQRERPIDVLFLGASSPRQSRYVDAAAGA